MLETSGPKVCHLGGQGVKFQYLLQKFLVNMFFLDRKRLMRSAKTTTLPSSKISMMSEKE